MIDLRKHLRRGDHVVIGQACGEPVTLVEALVEQGEEIGDLTVFIATSFSQSFRASAAKAFTLTSMGAIGSLRAMAKANLLQVIPVHVSQVAPLIAAGVIRCDAALVQLSPPDRTGEHSFGLISDYVRQACETARVVVAEVNEHVPFTFGETIMRDDVSTAVVTDRPPVEVPPATIGETDQAIARHAAGFIDDGAVIQTGVGAVPDALLRLLHDRRDLGVHSGMLGDGLVELVEAGVVTNARKRIDRGVSINGALIGTRRLYGFAHRNAGIRMCPTSYTHDAAVLARLDRLVTINSGVEVDLSGQVNAEQAGGTYLGGTGGSVDFVRAGARSKGGHAIIALPSTARGGTVSRITTRLNGPVTTARADVDVVVTEFGAAQLKGQPIAERARRLTAVAHPDFREVLEREAAEAARRGY